MRNILFIFCIACCFGACKKNELSDPVVPPPSLDRPQLKLPLGAPAGDVITKQIGSGGGTLKSADGIMTVTVPAGAVDATVTFSIQQVENTLKTKARSYRLKPEGIAFKKPVTITYAYGALDFGLTDPKHLFLACQDDKGYYYSAKNTKSNQTNHTLSVETTHFSDWTFYSMYEFEIIGGQLTDGKIVLGENESIELAIKNLMTKPSNDPLDALLAPLYDPVTSAAWDLIPRKGTLMVNNAQGKALYTSPKTITEGEEVVVTVMLREVVGKDNQGNALQLMQLSQPIVFKSGDYFTYAESGLEISATEFGAELAPGFAVNLHARFSNGYHLTSYVMGSVPASYPYRIGGIPGSCTLELVTKEDESFIVIRPQNCDTGGEPVFSQGNFVITSVANSVGQYFEGNYTANLFHYSYCKQGVTKTISGKFRIKRKA